MVYAILVLGALLLAAVVLIGWLLVYRAQHPYTAEQLRRGQDRSVRASTATVSGKVREQLAPLLPEMLAEFNPREVRFLGSPVDFVVFDGLDEDDDGVRRIVFVEIKTGQSTLSTRERRVRKVIQAGRVEFRTITLHAPLPEVPEDTAAAAASTTTAAATVEEIVDPRFGPVEWIDRWSPT